MKKYFPFVLKTSLILVYLVIVAGALVRMTGSGMGCPDWPKCFGYYIPPTKIETLQWKPNKPFEKGQVIILNEKLWVANTNFITGKNYNPAQFDAFTKHDYADFNATKTWIEYINRLIGALAGLACFILAIFSFSYYKTNKNIIYLSWLIVFAMGFQGWLGAKVVYSVLNPIKITLHMLVALVIVALLLSVLKKVNYFKNSQVYNSKIKLILLFTLLLTVIQITFGTQVRQSVDEQIKSGYSIEIFGLYKPDLYFYFHRSFSILVVLTNLYLFQIMYKSKKVNSLIFSVLTVLFIEILTGILMYYFKFPFSTQAFHLVLASILFGIQFYMFIDQIPKKKQLIELV